MVYNQSCNAASTLDKRRPDLRDELGYIAPPNRKLPPVPGSNYNTCDRIKRGTALSKTINRFLACNFLFSVRLFMQNPIFVSNFVSNCIVSNIFMQLVRCGFVWKKIINLSP